MKRILVPTDFSVFSRNALEVASSIAQKFKSEITLFHVIDYNEYLTTSPGLNGNQITELHTKAQNEANKQLENAISEFKTEGITFHIQSSTGLLQDELQNLISIEDKFDLVVMGSKGSNGISELFLGSNAERIIRKSVPPVIIVNEDINDFKLENIVFVSDFDENPGGEFEAVKDLSEAFNATLHLVRINTPQFFEKTSHIESRMRSFVDVWKLQKYTSQQWDHTHFEGGIQQYVTRTKADLLVIGTHGRQGLAHLFLGSMAEDIANHLDLPIMTFKIKEHKSRFYPLTV